MKYEDLSFTIKYDNGEELINDITGVVPNPENDEEPYVTFTDYTMDENDEFNTYYGKLVKKNDNYSLNTSLTKDEIRFIKANLEEEITKYVNDTIQDNLTD